MIGQARGALVAACAVLASAGAGVAVAATADSGKPLLALTDPQGGATVGVAPQPGVLHVVYLATWCPECMEELPALADLHDRWAERDYRLVLVAVNTRQTAARLAKFIEAKQPPGQLLWDADGSAERSMKIEQLPTHVLVGPDGIELARSGSLTGIREPLERVLKAGGQGRR